MARSIKKKKTPWPFKVIGFVLSLALWVVATIFTMIIGLIVGSSFKFNPWKEE